MRMLRSIRVRLTLWHALLLGAFLVFFGAAVYIAADRALHAEVDADLRQAADGLASRLSGKAGAPDRESLKGLDDILSGSGVHAQVIDTHGSVVWRSASLAGNTLPLPPKNAASRAEQYTTTEWAGQAVRLHFAPVRQQGDSVYLVEVGESLDRLERELRDLRLVLLFGIPATLFLSFLGGLLLARWTLSPIDRITRAAQAIEANGLSYRIGFDASQDELGRLAAAFDEMIARLEQSFSSQQRFVADASHELRTPLTIMAGHLDVCLRNTAATKGDLRQTLGVLREEVEQMSRTVEALLTLARADASQEPLTQERVELDLLLEEVVADARRRYEGSHLRLTHVEPLVVPGSADLLRQLLRNLVENALEHTPLERRVEVAVTRRGREALVTVSDTGPGIAPEHLAHLFDRFYRVDKARSRARGGAGLGLSIAQWIAERHGGRITVDSEVGAGTTFTVTLPLPSRTQ
jgi:heavy metal sensor kinase